MCYDPKQSACCAAAYPPVQVKPALCGLNSTCCWGGESNLNFDGTAFCCSERYPCCGVRVPGYGWTSACCADGYVCCPTFDNMSVPTFPVQEETEKGMGFGEWMLQNGGGRKINYAQAQFTGDGRKKSKYEEAPYTEGCANVQTEFCCPGSNGYGYTSTPCPLGTLCCSYGGCCFGKNATSYKCQQGDCPN